MGVDGGGGVGSPYPAYLDMNLMNHPYMCNYFRDPPKHLCNLDGAEYNVCFLSNYACVRLKDIKVGDELFVECCLGS